MPIEILLQKDRTKSQPFLLSRRAGENQDGRSLKTVGARVPFSQRLCLCSILFLPFMHMLHFLRKCNMCMNGRKNFAVAAGDHAQDHSAQLNGTIALTARNSCMIFSGMKTLYPH